MRIRDVEAFWLHCPIPYEQQHVSDFGRLASFDMTLVRVTTEDGRVGHGEAKAAVGSAGVCAALVACIEQELRPQLIGQDARQIARLWEEMYSGSRAHYALDRGRAFPVLGRRGLTISAISGIDMALWDLLGQALDVPVMQLLGGACRDRMPAYASGGWADVDAIGAQLNGYVERGFKAVKMRVGVMDGDVATSVARVKAARAALGPNIGLMADAHGTWSVPEAKRFCAAVAGLRSQLGRGADQRRQPPRHRRGARQHAHPDRGRRERVHALRFPRPDRDRRGGCAPARPGDLRRDHRGRADRGAGGHAPARACAAHLGLGAFVYGWAAPGLRQPSRHYSGVLARCQPAAARSDRAADHLRQWVHLRADAARAGRNAARRISSSSFGWQGDEKHLNAEAQRVKDTEIWQLFLFLLSCFAPLR